MTRTAIPTPDNRGLLTTGTVIEAPGRYFDGARITEVSFTAYRVAHVGLSSWLSFDKVHGRPAPTTPLIIIN